ncbi:MAG: biotin--[acetyl-CoA-carboxylase] ligase [Acholeplasmatales bacterium]|nr:biotin--[acetyl-CoA-carboxylase] ligase [Acholeplasmatales bacterium]
MNNIIFNELESTNTYLKNHYKKYKDRDCIVALNQTMGRGRFDRVWESQRDLTFSWLFINNKALHHMIAPLAVCYALEEIGYAPMIKWPNDVYLNGKKLSGVLIENICTKDNTYTIVGIGCNTSYKHDYAYVDVDRMELLERIEEKYISLMNYDLEQLHKSYRLYSNTLNKEITFKGDRYKIVDYAYSGEIIIKNERTCLKVSANEIDIKSCLIF